MVMIVIASHALVSHEPLTPAVYPGNRLGRGGPVATTRREDWEEACERLAEIESTLSDLRVQLQDVEQHRREILETIEVLVDQREAAAARLGEIQARVAQAIDREISSLSPEDRATWAAFSSLCQGAGAPPYQWWRAVPGYAAHHGGTGCRALLERILAAAWGGDPPGDGGAVGRCPAWSAARHVAKVEMWS